ncbi:hypothetical protein Cgig2_024255 [Carnegiea gigantea]|uniref:Auxin-responsive protein n=1 Tax=Carnegiea gigantea TaxID=171969 RepID=A0A9Q1GMK3_9CARY|nr:hypothetical protein Cgig2_024255 [Carnegiea gigantea]
MAKGGKFTKLMKKLSFGKTTQTNTSASDSIGRTSSLRLDMSLSSSIDDTATSGGLHTVYVGKSRRRYLVSSDVMEHPLFRQLAGKSTDAGEVTVGCEKVEIVPGILMATHIGSSTAVQSPTPTPHTAQGSDLLEHWPNATTTKLGLQLLPVRLLHAKATTP